MFQNPINIFIACYFYVTLPKNHSRIMAKRNSFDRNVCTSDVCSSSCFKLTVGYVYIADVTVKSSLSCLDVFIGLHREAVGLYSKVRSSFYTQQVKSPSMMFLCVRPVTLPSETMCAS